MKICQITYSGFGGLGSVVFSLIGADEVREHEWIIGFIGDQPLDGSYPSRCADAAAAYEAFRQTPGRPWRAWRGLKRWLDRERPDAIICHSITAILACRWHAWRHRIPLLAVEHTPNQVKTRNERAASRVAMLVADRIVVLTQEYRSELQASHGWLYRPAKVAVIPNGIDTGVFFPSVDEAAGKSGKIRLGMAARFSFSKRQDLLVECMERLMQARPDLDVEICFAGDGPELGRVEQLARQSPAAARIRFDGLLDEQEVAPWLRGLDIYVHATEGETLSTSLLQAMATGVPIVASDIPGVHNLIGRNGEYGQCADNDIDAFSGKLLTVIESPAMRRSGERARERIMAAFSHHAMLDRYVSAIEGSRK